MPLYVWIALVLLVVATLWGIVHVFFQARVAWRSFKTFGPALDQTASSLEASAERLADTSDAFGSDVPRLDAALARLQSDLARLAVLRQALQDTRDSLGWILAVYPRK